MSRYGLDTAKDDLATGTLGKPGRTVPCRREAFFEGCAEGMDEIWLDQVVETYLHRAFDPILSEPVPDRLLDIIRQPPKS